MLIFIQLHSAWGIVNHIILFIFYSYGKIENKYGQSERYCTTLVLS